MIAQIDEQQIAMIAPAMNPAGEPNRLADMARPQRAAVMRPIAMHAIPRKKPARKGTETGPLSRQGTLPGRLPPPVQIV
jgi:hypothetical protein